MIANPFSKEDYNVIVQAIKLCDELIPLIHKMETCGQECEEIKENLSRYRTKLDSYKREFFSKGKPIWTQTT